MYVIKEGTLQLYKYYVLIKRAITENTVDLQTSAMWILFPVTDSCCNDNQ